MLHDSTAAATPDTTAGETSAQKPIKIVTHHYPDTDAWAGLWFTARFVAGNREHSFEFVKAGQKLSAAEADGFEVITFDTGHGKLDQHGKKLGRTSSFHLVCAEYGVLEDPGIKPILDLTVASDNVEKIDPCSIHYVLKGLPYMYKKPGTQEVDWEACLGFAFMLFDVICSQAREKAKSTEDFKTLGQVVSLDNGIKVGYVFEHPRLREAAYDAGCDVVVWTQKHWKGELKGKYYVGIQCNRNTHVTLESVVESLRIIEAGKRGLKAKGKLRDIGLNETCGKWFLHDSQKLIVCGSRAAPLSADDCTKLSTADIKTVVERKLAHPSLAKK